MSNGCFENEKSFIALPLFLMQLKESWLSFFQPSIVLVCTLEPSCFLFGRISAARKSAKMSLITRSGETGCCVTVIYFKSEPGSLDARFAGCFGGRPDFDVNQTSPE